jgi:hypothetical protein
VGSGSAAPAVAAEVPAGSAGPVEAVAAREAPVAVVAARVGRVAVVAAPAGPVEAVAAREAPVGPVARAAGLRVPPSQEYVPGTTKGPPAKPAAPSSCAAVGAPPVA